MFLIIMKEPWKFIKGLLFLVGVVMAWDLMVLIFSLILT